MCVHEQVGSPTKLGACRKSCGACIRCASGTVAVDSNVEKQSCEIKVVGKVVESQIVKLHRFIAGDIICSRKNVRLMKQA